MSRVLIVYYSWSNGNTRRIAEMLQEETGADIAEIETAVPYSGTYNEVVEQGQKEVEDGFEPEIKPLSKDISQYDIICIGTPTWWYTMAPAVKTFLYSNIWNGKIIVPFMTNGGWPGHVIRDIKTACTGASFKEPMEILFDSTGGSEMRTSEVKVAEWIKRVKNLSN